MTAEPAISLHGVVKRFGALTAVDHLDYHVPELVACVALDCTVSTFAGNFQVLSNFRGNTQLGDQLAMSVRVDPI